MSHQHPSRRTATAAVHGGAQERPSGAPVASPLVQSATSQSEPIVTSDGNGYVAIWSDARSDLSPTQSIAALTADGNASAPAASPVTILAMAFDGTDRVALSSEGSGFFGLRRVSSGGAIANAPYATVAIASSR